MQRISWAFVLIVYLSNSCFSQESVDSSANFHHRKVLLATGTGVIAIGSLVGLNQLWYKEYNTGKFHLFDDSKEWLQMDKIGHGYTTYQTARLMMSAFDWAGYSEKQKLYIGGSVGVVYMTAIEVMDGFSRGWGYSWADQLANLLGASLAISQEGFWKEQRLQVKFSYAKSGLAPYNPKLLGENAYSQLIKDYNGQTYWLSINPSSFSRKESRFPRWLNLAVGYSAYGMLGGHYNNVTAQEADGRVYKVSRERRYYLSVDVDLTRIRTRSKFLKTIFTVFNILKFPAPALEISGSKIRLHGLYY